MVLYLSLLSFCDVFVSESTLFYCDGSLSESIVLLRWFCIGDYCLLTIVLDLRLLACFDGSGPEDTACSDGSVSKTTALSYCDGYLNVSCLIVMVLYLKLLSYYGGSVRYRVLLLELSNRS